MSMLGASPRYRRDETPSLRVPVVMPLVEVTIDGDGQLDVQLDREPYSAESTLERADLEGVLNEITRDLGTPVRVEIEEPDGSTFTDIVTPNSEAKPAECSKHPSPGNALFSTFGVAGGGFTPGEQVTVAVVVTQQIANDAGDAQLRLPPSLVAKQPGVVLVGESSGTIAVSERAV